MTLISVLRNRVKQSGAIRYERAVRRFAKTARESEGAQPWSARMSSGVEGVVYGFQVRAPMFPPWRASSWERATGTPGSSSSASRSSRATRS